MIHRFKVVYALDVPVSQAVAAYLDAEHYAYMHSQYLPEHEALAPQEGTEVRIRQKWTFAGVSANQLCTTEYQPPGLFINRDLSSSPWYVPSVHHVVSTRTELRYQPDESGDRTLSELTVTLDLPLLLWPLRFLMQEKLTVLKREKDVEDMEMLFRRAKLFGRNNIHHYLAEHQFMLHKTDFVHYFRNDRTGGMRRVHIPASVELLGGLSPAQPTDERRGHLVVAS